MFIYYEEGNPEAVVAPDVFVVFGTANETVIVLCGKNQKAPILSWKSPRDQRAARTRDPSAAPMPSSESQSIFNMT